MVLDCFSKCNGITAENVLSRAEMWAIIGIRCFNSSVKFTDCQCGCAMLVSVEGFGLG